MEGSDSCSLTRPASILLRSVSRRRALCRQVRVVGTAAPARNPTAAVGGCKRAPITQVHARGRPHHTLARALTAAACRLDEGLRTSNRLLTQMARRACQVPCALAAARSRARSAGCVRPALSPASSPAPKPIFCTLIPVSLPSPAHLAMGGSERRSAPWWRRSPTPPPAPRTWRRRAPANAHRARRPPRARLCLGSGGGRRARTRRCAGADGGAAASAWAGRGVVCVRARRTG